MKTKIKMVCGKALRLSLVAATLALAGSGVANATLISQTFVSGVEGGIVTYDDDLGSNQLRLTFNNTSSSWNGAITGIVFNVTTNIAAASVLSFKDGNNTAITGWTVGLNVDNNITPGNTIFEIAFTADNGINGGIYNSGVATDFTNVVPDIATLILTVTDPNPWSLASIDSDSILRMQRTGANGEGSLKIVTSTSSSSGTSGQSSSGNTIPEPGMLALLSAGLLGQALLIRQRRRRQK
ncbi:MAG: PEP-CTERM protein-sorting domain-containing protein [Candidatus Nitrotoga sp. LAW]|nr:MAG: PEP-CTERM protein-sorting domain-containing protein [Candidatus Nitrotoga sp. LAW]